MMRTTAGVFFRTALARMQAARRAMRDFDDHAYPRRHASQQPKPLASKARVRFHSATLLCPVALLNDKKFMRHKKPARCCGARRFGQIMKPGASALGASGCGWCSRCACGLRACVPITEASLAAKAWAPLKALFSVLCCPVVHVGVGRNRCQ